MGTAHEPVGRALSSHANVLAELQPEARAWLQRAHEAEHRRTVAGQRQNDARQERDQGVSTAASAQSELSEIESAILAKTQELLLTGVHLLGDAIGDLDPHLRWLHEQRQVAERALIAAQDVIRAADGVIRETEQLIAHAENDLAAACRRAEQIGSEVLASVRTAWRIISEVDGALEGIWRHVQQAALSSLDRTTGEIAADLSRLSPALGFAFRHYVQFEEGVVDGVVGIVAGVADLGRALWDISPARYALDPAGWRRSDRDLVGGVETISWKVEHHPGDFFKTFGENMLNWHTWAHDPAKALGELVPSIALAVVTAGAGPAVTTGVKAGIQVTGAIDDAVGTVQAAEGTESGTGGSAASHEGVKLLEQHIGAERVVPTEPVITPDDPVFVPTD